MSKKSGPLVIEDVRVPQRLVRLLRETLTERGVQQWMKSKSRYLAGQTPLECLKGGDKKARAKVLEAAGAYVEGAYV